MKAIQFIGTQRSGSNLLRVMLNQLPQVSAPHPPHILKTFFPLLPSYGSLTNPANFNLLVSDVCDWVNNNPVPWGGCHFNTFEVASRTLAPDLISIFMAIHEQKAEIDKADYWCCKSMESVHYLREIEESNLRPFYIYLYRDGRDVALSFMKAIVGPKHVYQLASKWREEQRLSLDLIKTLPDERFISICYEDFITSPGKTVKAICEKIDVNFSEDIFNYFRSAESLNTAESGEMWKNVAKPVIDTNFNKFRNELSEEEIIIFERVAGEILIELGYKTCYDVKGESFSKDEIAEFNRLDKVLRENAVAKAATTDKEKRQTQERLLNEITSRSKSIYEG